MQDEGHIHMEMETDDLALIQELQDATFADDVIIASMEQVLIKTKCLTIKPLD